MIEQLFNTITNIKYDEIIASIAMENIGKRIYAFAHDMITGENEKIKTTRNDKNNLAFELICSDDVLYQHINSKIRFAEEWCMNIHFKDLNEKKYLTDVFIPLDFYLTPRKVHIDSLKEKKMSVDDIIRSANSSLVILGGPGAGKTTLSQYLCLLCFAQKEMLQSTFRFPFVVRFRDLDYSDYYDHNKEMSFYEILLSLFGIHINFSPSYDIIYPTFELTEKHKELTKKELKDLIAEQRDAFQKTEQKRGILIRKDLIKNLTVEILNRLNILIILDGYDEISDYSLYKIISKDIESLSYELKKSKFILTSRTGEFDLNIQHSTTLEICPLSEEQILNFIKKWQNDERKANDLHSQIINSPFKDTTIRPINIAHLCALYDRYKQVPDKPKTVYRKIIMLLLEDWDAQRGIFRKTKYSYFIPDRKFEFLSRLSYLLTSKFKSTTFDKNQIRKCYEEICGDFELPQYEVSQVVKELESHTGLFLQAGFDKFEFAHKSLQEYLTAEYLVKQPIGAIQKTVLFNLPNELAITISLSSEPNITLASYFLIVLNAQDYSMIFLKSFLSRLVMEKPDYTSNPILAKAIAKIFTFNFRNKQEENFESINLLIDKLLYSHLNIKKSFNQLNKYYRFSTAEVAKKSGSKSKLQKEKNKELIQFQAFPEFNNHRDVGILLISPKMANFFKGV